jgi:ATP/maltotriose-dependent transcriptional regulator MalT
MFNFRNRNADYCSVIAKVAGILGQITADARHRVYERARSAVLAEMNRAYPPLDQRDIAAAQMCLEAAIKEIEADALRSQRAQTALHMPSTLSSLSVSERGVWACERRATPRSNYATLGPSLPPGRRPRAGARLLGFQVHQHQGPCRHRRAAAATGHE